MGYFLRGHPGSGDHGSEDRVRGTCAILRGIELCSARPEEDWRYGLGKLMPLIRQRCQGELSLSVEDGPSVLWDWTGPVSADLGQHERIFVPDRRSYAVLTQAGFEKKARLGPDPLFLVEPQTPPAWEPGQVGLCGCPRLPYACWRSLIPWLLTRYTISMIPYRSREPGLQRVLAKDLNPVRFCPDGPSPKLRDELCRCEAVIGSPAPVMAAWSRGVPGLCVGFSPRAVGLAKELFGEWKNAVVPIASLKTPEDLILAVRCFLCAADTQRKKLETAVPNRKAQSMAWDQRALER